MARSITHTSVMQIGPVLSEILRVTNIQTYKCTVPSPISLWGTTVLYVLNCVTISGIVIGMKVLTFNV